MIAPILSLITPSSDGNPGGKNPLFAREQLEQKLAQLREVSGVLKNLPARDAFAFSKIKDGIPRGAITEISGMHGSGKTEIALQFIAENTGIRVAWIEDRLTAYPCAFPQLGVELSRLLFIEGGAETLWSAHQVLRSQLFGIVVISSASLSATELRRLQLAAEESHTSVLLLSEELRTQGTWPISLQIQTARRTSSKFKVIKGTGRLWSKRVS